LASLGVRLRHVVVLTLLRDHGTRSQQALADTLRLDPSNVVGLLNEMEDVALIARRRNPDDRRRHVVEITDEGRECLARAEAALGEVEDAALAALDITERRELYRLLAKATEGEAHSCVEAVLDGAGGPVSV
jgi:DNA-binding MarR family transcriptional regulator